MSEESQRPKFLPSHVCTECLHNLPNDDNANWVPVISCPAGFPPEIVSDPNIVHLSCLY